MAKKKDSNTELSQNLRPFNRKVIDGSVVPKSTTILI